MRRSSTFSRPAAIQLPSCMSAWLVPTASPNGFWRPSIALAYGWWSSVIAPTTIQVQSILNCSPDCAGVSPNRSRWGTSKSGGSMPDPSATPVALMVGNRSVTSHRTMCYRVLLVCGLAFLFRIAFVWAIYRSWPVWYFWHNGFEANNIAASIVNGNGFASPFGVATGPTAWLPPIYPALNALWFWLFGTFRGPALICILFFNIACGTATVGVLYTVGSRFSRQVAF